MRTIFNYTVRWYSAEGKAEQQGSLETLEQAQQLADKVRKLDGTQRVLILRSGKHPRSSRWSPTRPPERGKALSNEHWTLPAGFVDTEADKHGPQVPTKLDYREPPKTLEEKVSWFRSNPNPFPNAWPCYR